MLPEMASTISARLGEGLRSSNAFAAISIPGVQKPHCAAKRSMKATCSGCNSAPRLMPSAVSTETQTWGVTLRSQGIVSRPSGPTTLAPGTFDTGDIDGDGAVDVAVSGDGDARVFWMRQLPDHTFQTYVIADEMGQAGGGAVADLDGDGHADVVFSSYEKSVLKVYSVN